MHKTLKQMKKRLEEAMNEAGEAEEIIPLLKEAIAKFELTPADLFERAAGRAKAKLPTSVQKGRGPSAGAAMYLDGNGNTWAGRGRRPAWLNEALALGKSLEEFRSRSGHLRRAK